jgi:hypothetical protein
LRNLILKRLVCLTIVAVAGFFVVAWLTAPPNLTTMERFDKLVQGLSEAEVVELLNASGTEGTLLPDGRDINNIVSLGYLPIPVSHWRQWKTDNGRIIAVAFDANGRVISAVGFMLPESWLNKGRRWLHAVMP